MVIIWVFERYKKIPSINKRNKNPRISRLISTLHYFYMWFFFSFVFHFVNVLVLYCWFVAIIPILLCVMIAFYRFVSNCQPTCTSAKITICMVVNKSQTKWKEMDPRVSDIGRERDRGTAATYTLIPFTIAANISHGDMETG